MGGSTRGLGAADLAMHVVLPEIDGRIIDPRHFLQAGARRDARSSSRARARADRRSRRLCRRSRRRLGEASAQTPRTSGALACVLSDYPAKGGRVGYAVGLDTPRSVAAIGEALRDAGYDIGAPSAAEG